MLTGFVINNYLKNNIIFLTCYYNKYKKNNLDIEIRFQNIILH